MIPQENTKEYGDLKELLEDNEKPSFEVVERRLGGGKWFGVAHAYATNYRIIVIRIYVLGLRKSLKIIKYSDIQQVEMERGVIYCKIHFALQGEMEGSEGDRKWIMGLKYSEALEIVKFINRMTKRNTLNLIES